MRLFVNLYRWFLVCFATLLTATPCLQAAATVTAATGGNNLSADIAANAPTPGWTNLGAIVISEAAASADIGGGTLVLQAPYGFIFNTSSVPSITFTAARNITAASVTLTNPALLTITLAVNAGSLQDTLTLGATTRLQVRPTTGSLLTNGVIYRPTTDGGTAVIVGITTSANTNGSGGTSFGALKSIVGAARKLAFQTAPPAAATYGTKFSPAPAVLVQDQFGNTRNTANGSADNATVVRATRGAGLGALQGGTNATAANGVATFTNLWHNRPETITAIFSSGSLTNVVSDNIVVSPAVLTVQANDVNRLYGAPNPVLTASYSGFVNGETLATSGVTGSPDLVTFAALGSPTGSYLVMASPGTLAATNYAFSFSNAMLTVAKAPLAVTADNLWRVQGATNPPLTVSYTGLVLGETPGVLAGNPSVTTTAVTGSPLGDYPITVTAGTLVASNYALTFVNGNLVVAPAGALFADNFTRATDPGALSPWVVQAGNWSVTGGWLVGGTNALNSYGFAFLTNFWSDHAAQAQVKLSAGSYGGGLAVRLLAASGRRYAAWIYPEGSSGGANVVKLLKFSDWDNFTVVQQANLPAVGTNAHLLKVAARTNHIAVHCDGVLMLDWTDPDPAPYLSGGISLESWTATNSATFAADNVLVSRPGSVVASNDTYTVRKGGTLTVAAPGVVGNDTAELLGLTATLAAAPAHGTVNLSTNGGFTYTPVTSYSGTDTFTYRAQDDYSTSAVATVTITVTPNRVPTATNDSFTLMANTMLTVPAPGILTNDADADGDSLTAVLATGPTHGTLNLNSNGSFTYVPTAHYVGADSFTYRASDGQTNSSPATVALTVTAFSPLLSDAFTRASLSPWVVQAGNWGVTGNALVGGTNALASYGFVYLTNQWSDYSAQGLVKLSAGGFGGGLSGRLNPVTGARYAAWIYPEGSPGGSSVLKLLKFENWTNFTVVQQAYLSSVGTNGHTLKLAMQGNRVAVHFDGTLRLSWSDPAAPLSSGGISFDLWTGETPWTLTADDVVVRPIQTVLATNDSYSVRMASTLTVPVAGVLTNDAGEFGGLTAVLISGPAHGTLSLSTNGGFTYTPVSTYSGTDSFTYQATDGVNTSSPATVTITIPVNRAPTATNDSYAVTRNVSLTVTAPGVLVNDTDLDGDPLSAVLVSSSSHGVLNLSTNGGFTYAPAVGYTGADSFTYRAHDGLTNSGLATVTFTVAEPGPLFTENFTRTNPGTLSPWVVLAGNWGVTNGLLQGGTNALLTYGSIYLTNQWTNYEAQARVQFPTGAYGGGLGGRLNPATGTRYAGWIYPEGSSGGSNLWKLLKFQNWDDFTVLQQGSLPSVGTNWHTLKLAFQGNRISFSYDSNTLASITDSAPYWSGGLSLDFWTDTVTPWKLTADDVLVNALAPDESVTAVGIVPNPASQTVTVTFQGAVGGLYHVQATTNLAAPNSWLTVATNLAGADGRWTYTDSLTNRPGRFYRAAKP
jgi:hypothetical protein